MSEEEIKVNMKKVMKEVFIELSDEGYSVKIKKPRKKIDLKEKIKNLIKKIKNGIKKLNVFFYNLVNKVIAFFKKLAQKYKDRVSNRVGERLEKKKVKQEETIKKLEARKDAKPKA